MNVPMRDRKDIVVLQTAITGEAEIICTLDTDFYDLPDRTVSASAPQFHRAGVHRVPVSSSETLLPNRGVMPGH